MRSWPTTAWGVVCALLVAAGPALADRNPHNGLRWNGPGTCVTCHWDEARDMHASAHYQWQGEAPYSASIFNPPLQGKLKTAFNSYCINITGNWGGCGSCHIGRGAMPSATPSTAEFERIDCLMCHQEKYKRVKVNGVFVPDTANMTITMDEAVRTVHEPTRTTCLQCHARGGGGDNYKRGDLALAHATTRDRAFDVHMSSTGADLACQQCHLTSRHRIAGRGSDLRETDLDVQMTCSNASCHRGMAGAESHSNATLGRHVARVACQTCHVGRVSARNASDTSATEATEVHRDWADPHVTASGAIHPRPTLVNDITPIYRFWNGSSTNYSLGEPAFLDPATLAYPTSRPVGAIDDQSPVARLFPFKYKTASQPFATLRSILIPLDTSVYFASGNLAAATAKGLSNVGYAATDPWQMVKTDTLQLLTHEIAPKGSALRCEDCHGAGARQMSLPALGYTLKGPSSTVCAQCHRAKASPGWKDVHNKHVADKKIDCSMCHAFTRPERGLVARIVRGD